MIAMDCAPQIHVAAIHAKAGYNGDTPGIGVLCSMTDTVRVAVGRYYNSLRRNSDYASVVWQPVKAGPIRAGIAGGALTGYKEYAIPFAALAVSVPIGPMEAHIVVLPSSQNVSPATAELSLSFKF